MRRLRAYATYSLAWAFAEAPLFACPVCFQIEDGQAASGVRAAVYVLMGVTVVVLGGFGLFVRRLFSGKS